MAAPTRRDEDYRLAVLAAHGIDLTKKHPRLQNVVRVAKHQFDAPIAAISLIDHDREWFIARYGLEIGWAERASSFGAHSLFLDGPFYVNCALDDPRFQNNALVRGKPRIVTYAGAPLRSDEGVPLGCLFIVYDRVRSVSQRDRRQLEILADIAGDLLRAERRDAFEMQESVPDQVNTPLIRSPRMAGWTYDVEKDELTGTNEIYQIYGIEKSARLNVKEALDFYAKDDRNVLEDAFNACLSSGEPYDLHLSFFSADGQSKAVRSTGYAGVRHDKIERLYGSFREV